MCPLSLIQYSEIRFSLMMKCKFTDMKFFFYILNDKKNNHYLPPPLIVDKVLLIVMYK